MDPRLLELLRQDAGRDTDEIEAIIRTIGPSDHVPDTRIVSRFGPVATCRIRKSNVRSVRHADNVLSLKASHPLGPEEEPPSLFHEASLPGSTVATDRRRPASIGHDGSGVVIGIVDWGCDFAHPNFRNDDGTTRLISLWDQRGRPQPGVQNRYGYGSFHSTQQINRALASASPYQTLGYHPADADQNDAGTHGTHVMDIAAGNGRSGGPAGVAPGAQLVFVHLSDRGTGGLATLGDSVRILEAIDFVARTAGGRPWVINLSVGRHGGCHTGRTLVEMALDHLLESGSGRFIVQSTGNYFGKDIHASGHIRSGETRALGILIDDRDVTPNELEIWYSARDSFSARTESPTGSFSPWTALGEQSDITENGSVIGRLYNRANDPNAGDHCINIFIYTGAPPGRWQVHIRADTANEGEFHAWIERDEACPTCQARFEQDDSDDLCTTGTLANGHLPLVVGAYNAHTDGKEIAPFSSSGPTRDNRAKPDLVAPGISILAARSTPRSEKSDGRLLTRKSGSSMAAPHVTGAVALCMQAAERPLRAHEIRHLLMRSAQPVVNSSHRTGSGYLDIAQAEHAARALRTHSIVQPIPGIVATQQQLARQEITMRSDTETTLARYDQLARESTSRVESERAMLAESIRLNGSSSIPRTIDPDELYGEIVYNRNSPLTDLLGESFTVLARPGEYPVSQPRAGDILLRVQLGEQGWGHVGVLADPNLVSHQALRGLPVRSESRQPGMYGTVIEGGAFPHVRSDSFARRILDAEGRMPEGQLLLRSTEAISCTEEFTTEGGLAEQADLQHITHVGPFRLAYDRLTTLGVIEPLPGRDTRRFRGTAALQAALNTWATYIPRVMPSPAYILTAGLYVDKPGQHGNGNAIDVDGFWWSDTNRFLANDAPTDWRRYVTIEATLRRVFGTVLNYDYNADHHDHWHCDLGGSTRWRAVRSQALYAQRALNVIWGESLSVDGQWGRTSQAAAVRQGYDFTTPGGWDRFLDNIIDQRSTTPARIAGSGAEATVASAETRASGGTTDSLVTTNLGDSAERTMPNRAEANSNWNRSLPEQQLPPIDSQGGSNVSAPPLGDRFSTGESGTRFANEAVPVFPASDGASEVQELHSEQAGLAESPPALLAIAGTLISASQLGIAIFDRLERHVFNGSFSFSSAAASYIHNPSPRGLTPQTKTFSFAIAAHHPRIGIGTQHFYFQLTLEYDGFNIRRTSIVANRQRSSTMIASSFTIALQPARYSAENEAVAAIVYNISGRWDPVGVGDEDFDGNLIIDAQGEMRRFVVNSPNGMVWRHGSVTSAGGGAVPRPTRVHHHTTVHFDSPGQTRLSDANVRHIYGWFEGLPIAVRDEIRAGRFPIDLSGRASTSGTISRNFEIANARARSVLTALRRFAGDEANIVIRAPGELGARTPDDREDPNERRVDIEVSYILYQMRAARAGESYPSEWYTTEPLREEGKMAEYMVG